MNEEWKYKLQDSLADFEEAAPERLWNDIEGKLPSAVAGIDNAKSVRGKAHIVFLRIVVAAACAACGVGVFLKTDDSVSDSDKTVARLRQNDIPRKSTSAKEEILANAVETVGNSHVRMTGTLRRTILATGNRLEHVAGAPYGETCRDAAEIEAAKTVAGQQASEEVKKETYVVTHKVMHEKSSDYMTQSGKHSQTSLDGIPRTDKAPRFSATLYAANSIGSGSSSMGMQMLAASYGDAMLSSAPQGDNHIYGYYVGQSNNESVKHHNPVRAGLSVRYALTRRLGLETGFVYSYLSSDISQGDDYNCSTTEQRLHFVGIPLAVDYSVWNNKWLRLYVSGGGMVEKNVRGKSTATYFLNGKPQSSTEYSVRMKELQWSVNAAAGVEVDFVRNVGLYVEPGVGYYFDNGSSLKTSYSEKPLNFNLRFGMRYSFR